MSAKRVTFGKLVSKFLALSIILVFCGCSKEKIDLSLLLDAKLGVTSYQSDHGLKKGEARPSLNELKDYIPPSTYKLFSESRICAYVYTDKEVQRIFPGLIAIDCRERPTRAIFLDSGTQTGDMFLYNLLDRRSVKGGDETKK